MHPSIFRSQYGKVQEHNLSSKQGLYTVSSNAAILASGRPVYSRELGVKEEGERPGNVQVCEADQTRSYFFFDHPPEANDNDVQSAEKIIDAGIVDSGKMKPQPPNAPDAEAATNRDMVRARAGDAVSQDRFERHRKQAASGQQLSSQYKVFSDTAAESMSGSAFAVPGG